MQFYGEDCPPRRIQKVEDIHANEVLIRAAILEEFKATFNLACLFADALYNSNPDHPLNHVSRFEGMLGYLSIKGKNEQSRDPVNVECVNFAGETGNGCSKIPPRKEEELDAIPEPVESSSVSSVHESGVLPVPMSQRDGDTGAGTIPDSEASSSGDMLAQGSGDSDERGDGTGGSDSGTSGSDPVPITR